MERTSVSTLVTVPIAATRSLYGSVSKQVTIWSFVSKYNRICTYWSVVNVNTPDEHMNCVLFNAV